MEAEACSDHIHMLVSMSVSQFMGYLKGKSSLMIFDRYAKERTTILSAPATVRILWAITTTVLSAIRRERDVCIKVSFSTFREAVASSKRIIGAFLEMHGQ